ncbi:putative Related to lipoprotein releasing system transmembrane protein [Nitrospina gracilis 3/211]|uniref:Putative Related to lipoprotein releasing system transmembrane protein n=1 Tax=Nitrospina gracilis (strain 3/211) TaxID=1266370 RepID=M1Z1G4_NITG3|nr:FtsX-like permease family protein [Nitrospina gracilis]CCQ91350.1 putative Related to lipoprotein releasing system transmembrane protein [Nitrospina gracilis 3/211]
MIRFTFKGILRDKSRSLFPFLIVTVGVALMVGLLGFMDGIFMGMLDMSAKLDTGHLRFVNKPFYKEEHLVPLDRALADQEETGEWLEANSDPRIEWTPRIRWGALMDVPDEEGNTVSQTPVTGMAVQLLNPASSERERLDLKASVREGRVPENPHEMLVGYQLAESLGLKPGSMVTLLGQTFDGGLATDNYTVTGLIQFGVTAMDKKMALFDLADAQHTFYMDNMVTDWLGFLPASVPYDEYADIKQAIEEKLPDLRQNPPKQWAKDDFPIALTILDQRNIEEIARKFELIRGVIVLIFTFLMVLVLWNAGLLNGIHRYGEMGLRLAMGETHKHLVASLTLEAFAVGVLGSIAGCVVGGLVVFYSSGGGGGYGRRHGQIGIDDQ